MYVYITDISTSLQYVATLLCESRKSKKMLPNHESRKSKKCYQIFTTIDKLMMMMMMMNLKFNLRSSVTCHKNITLMILLKYVYNTRSIV